MLLHEFMEVYVNRVHKIALSQKCLSNARISITNARNNLWNTLKMNIK